MKLKPQRNLGLNGILCDTGAVLYQLSYQANLELVTLWVRNIPVDGDECKWRYERSYIWKSCSEKKVAQNEKNCSKYEKLAKRSRATCGKSCQKLPKKLKICQATCGKPFIYYFHQQNNYKRIKANEDQDFCFCGGTEKSRFEWVRIAVLNFFWIFSYEEELTVSFISFWFY